jgi:hypothetical protein
MCVFVNCVCVFWDDRGVKTRWETTPTTRRYESTLHEHVGIPDVDFGSRIICILVRVKFNNFFLLTTHQRRQ